MLGSMIFRVSRTSWEMDLVTWPDFITKDLGTFSCGTKLKLENENRRRRKGMAYLCFTLGGAFKMSPILPPLSTHFARMSNRKDECRSWSNKHRSTLNKSSFQEIFRSSH